MTLHTVRVNVGEEPTGIPDGITIVSVGQISGTTNQASAIVTVGGRPNGYKLFGRFKSNYNGTDGKSETATFPLEQVILFSQTEFTFTSTATLASDGTPYTFLIYGESEDGFTQEPTGNGLIASSPFTLSAGDVAPTDVVPKVLRVIQGTVEDTVIDTLSANGTAGSTFTKVSGGTSLVNVSSSGVVTAAADLDDIGFFEFEVDVENSANEGDPIRVGITLEVIEPTVIDAAEEMPEQNAGTVDSEAALKSLLDSWEADWNGTASGLSLSTSDPRIVQLDNGQYSGALDLTGYVFPRRVTIRGEGGFTRDQFGPTCGTEFAGSCVLTNCENLTVMGMRFKTGESDIDGCENCTIERCVVEGGRPETVAQQAIERVTNRPAYLTDSTDCYYVRCHISSGRTALGYWRGNTVRCGFTGCTFDYTSGDLVKAQNETGSYSHTGTVVSWCLLSARECSPGGTHNDIMQLRCPLTNGLFEYNFMFLNDVFGNEEGPDMQGWFWGGGSSGSANSLFRQCLAGIPNGLVKGTSHGTDSMFNMSQYVFPPGFAAWHPGYTVPSTAENFDDNIMCRRTTGQNNLAGPNGIHITMNDASELDAQIGYITRVPSRSDTIGWCKPVDNTYRSHWDNGDPTGAYDLLRFMFDEVDHNHWKDWGWPTAAGCHITSDGANELAGASGTYTTFNDNGAYTGGS